MPRNSLFNMFDLIEKGKTGRWAQPGLDHLGATAPREKRKLDPRPAQPVKRLMTRRQVQEIKTKIRNRLEEEALHDELLKGME